MPRALGEEVDAAVQHQIIHALSESRMRRRDCAVPDIAHDPGFGIHRGIQPSRPDDDIAKEIAQSLVRAAALGAVIEISDFSGLEIFFSVAKVRVRQSGTIKDFRVADKFPGGQRLKKFGVRILQCRRDRQQAAIGIGVED